jgi:adenylate kinase
LVILHNLVRKYPNHALSSATTAKPALTMKINLILFGPPGSGKGTQAAKLVDKFNLLHISTGDLFRYELGNNTPLGQEARKYMDRGELVPDSVTIAMLRNKVEANPEVSGYIFDGFPRTIPQCEALDELMGEMDQEISKLIMLEVPDEEIVSRLVKRAQTSGRADDGDESIIRKRIDVYKKETTPVFDHYNQIGRSIKIKGVGQIDEIFGRLCSEVETI